MQFLQKLTFSCNPALSLRIRYVLIKNMVPNDCARDGAVVDAEIKRPDGDVAP